MDKNENNKCILCNRAFTQHEEQQQLKMMLISTECFHMIHRQCLSETAVQQIKKSKIICCPKADCKKQIQDYELRDLMGKDYEELEKIIQAQIMAQNSSLVSCSCGYVMEQEEAKVDLNFREEYN
jgi:hypothetical protein